MPIPPFILTLRERIGTDLLWLSGVTGVVVGNDDRVLLTRRSDTGRWALISGILEPGEQPAVALRREIGEETGVDAEVQALVSVRAQRPMRYPNGDHAQYLDLLFLCRHLGGVPRVGDDESLEVGWFSPTALPDDVGHHTEQRLADVRDFLADPAGGPIFDR